MPLADLSTMYSSYTVLGSHMTLKAKRKLRFEGIVLKHHDNMSSFAVLLA